MVSGPAPGVPSGTTAFSVRLPNELAELLRTHAFITKTSGNEIIKQALVAYLKTEGVKMSDKAAWQTFLDHRAALQNLDNAVHHRNEQS